MLVSAYAGIKVHPGNLGKPRAMTPLLDTHTPIWWLNDSNQLSAAQRRVIKSASPQSPLLVSDFSLWEVATLHNLGRIQLTIPLRGWLDKEVARPLVRRHGFTPAIAAELATLPDSFPRDPADRILVATARTFGATLLTQDGRIIDAALVDTLS